MWQIQILKSWILKRIYKTENFKLFKVCSVMHSIPARAPLAQIPASVRCGMEAISLWQCWGTIEPSTRLYCWIESFSLFSWKYPIDSMCVQVRNVGWPIKHSNIMVSKALGSGFGTVGRCYSPAVRGNQHLHKACQKMEAFQSVPKSPGRRLHWLWTW